MLYFSEIVFKTPIISSNEYSFTLNKNLSWEIGQKALVHYSDTVWWTGKIIVYNKNTGDCKLSCLESLGCTNGHNTYTGTIDLYSLRGPIGIRGPPVLYYSEVIGQLVSPSMGDEITLRPRKRQLSWQNGQRILVYTDDNDWIYGTVLKYENDQLTIIVLEKDEHNCDKKVLKNLYIDISGIRGVQGPPGPPCKWSAYGIASHVQSQTIKKNIKTSIKFDKIIQDDLNIFKDNNIIIIGDEVHSIGIKFLTTGFNEGVLFLSLELVSRPDNEIIPDIRYTFVKTILPQQPAVCEIFPPIKTFEKGDVYKMFAWFSGTDVDVDIKMLYIYYST